MSAKGDISSMTDDFLSFRNHISLPQVDQVDGERSGYLLVPGNYTPFQKGTLHGLHWLFMQYKKTGPRSAPIELLFSLAIHWRQTQRLGWRDNNRKTPDQKLKPRIFYEVNIFSTVWQLQPYSIKSRITLFLIVVRPKYFIPSLFAPCLLLRIGRPISHHSSFTAGIACPK